MEDKIQKNQKEIDLMMSLEGNLEMPELAYLFNNSSDIVDLPSLGKLYKNHKKTLLVEHMTTKDENILSNPGFITKNIQFDTLLARKIKDKDITPLDLLDGDYEAVLLFLRISGLGKDYEVEVTDPKDNSKFKATIDLSELNLKELNENPDEEGLFSFVLPESKAEVKYKLLTKRETKAIIERIEKEQQKQTFNGVIFSLSQQIKKIKLPQRPDVWLTNDGSYLSKYFNAFIEKMKPIDSVAFREEVKRIAPGVDMRWEFTNPITGHSFRTSIPIDITFFYPNARVSDDEVEDYSYVD